MILVPAGLYLSILASQNRFDSTFYIVQAVELLVGAVNLTLMSLNIRDGRRLSGRRRSPT